MSQVESKPTRDRALVRPAGARRRSDDKRARAATPSVAPAASSEVAGDPARQWIAAALVLAAGLWAYWPTLVGIVTTWNREPDYSHGFLVVPLALYFLVARKGSFPGIGRPALVLGFGLVGLSVVARLLGALFYFEFVDGYSILLWIAGAVAIFGGGRLLGWTLPAIGFLFFAVPLPFGIETGMSAPLQRVATKITCWTLQTLGQPAFAEGNVILMGDHKLEVAQACSGLRLFMSVVAMAYLYMVLVRRVWWEKAVLLFATVPVAIISNAARIVATGLLLQVTTGEVAHKFSHDFAGWAMIPLAAALFSLVLWYLGKLIREDEVLEMSAIMRRSEQ
jgi:exosortase